MVGVSGSENVKIIETNDGTDITTPDVLPIIDDDIDDELKNMFK